MPTEFGSGSKRAGRTSGGEDVTGEQRFSSALVWATELGRFRLEKVFMLTQPREAGRAAKGTFRRELCSSVVAACGTVQDT